MFVGIIPSHVDPQAFVTNSHLSPGLGHRLWLGDGGLFSGAELLPYNWGERSRAGEYCSIVPAGKAVAVRLFRDGSVHFIVGGRDLGVAGRVRVGPDVQYRLLIDVYSSGTRVSITVG